MSRTLIFGLLAGLFLVVVAVAAFLSSRPAAETDGLLALLIWLAVSLAGVAFLVWFIVTMNKIARHLAEQTRLARHSAELLDRLAQPLGEPSNH